MTDEVVIGSPLKPSPVKGANLLGEVLVVRPTRTGMMETEIGTAEVFYAETLLVTPDPDADTPYINCGEIPYFWGVVRRQLGEFFDGPQTWYGVRLIRAEKKDPESPRSAAYMFEGLDPEETVLCVKAVKAHKANPLPVTESEAPAAF